MRRVIVIAVAGFSLTGCGSLSWDAFKATPPIVQVRLEFGAPWRRCPHVARAGLQDALLGRHSGFRHQFLRHLHDEQVPAGHHPGAGQPGRGRLEQQRVDKSRSQSRGRAASAVRPTTEARPQNAQAAKAKTAQGRCSPACRGRIGAPGTATSTRGRACTSSHAGTSTLARASAGTPAARALIGCTAPDKGADCTGIATCLHWSCAPWSSSLRAERHLNEWCDPERCPSDDRSVRPVDKLFAGVGHGPMRSALLLLHVGGHDLSAQGRFAHA